MVGPFCHRQDEHKDDNVTADSKSNDNTTTDSETKQDYTNKPKPLTIADIDTMKSRKLFSSFIGRDEKCFSSLLNFFFKSQDPSAKEE